MADKPHLYFRKEADGVVDFKPPSRGGGKKPVEEKDYTVESWLGC